MRTPKLQPLPVAIAEVKARIEHWRATRNHRGPMAAELWSEAGRLAREHGIYAIARALRVNYEALKSKTGGAGVKTRSVRLPALPLPNGGRSRAVIGPLGVPPAERETERKAAFIRLEPPVLSPLGSTIVEVCGKDGTRLSVQLPVAVAVDVVGLVAAFVKRR